MSQFDSILKTSPFINKVGHQTNNAIMSQLSDADIEFILKNPMENFGKKVCAHCTVRIARKQSIYCSVCAATGKRKLENFLVNNDVLLHQFLEIQKNSEKYEPVECTYTDCPTVVRTHGKIFCSKHERNLLTTIKRVGYLGEKTKEKVEEKKDETPRKRKRIIYDETEDDDTEPDSENQEKSTKKIIDETDLEYDIKTNKKIKITIHVE